MARIRGGMILSVAAMALVPAASVRADLRFHNADGTMTHPNQDLYEGRYHWIAFPLYSYVVKPAQVGHDLQWALGDREPGASIDRIVLSQRPNLSDDELDRLSNSEVEPAQGASPAKQD